jgi:signal transduction histidine kinase
MKAKMIVLSRRYEAALGEYLNNGVNDGPAFGLKRAARLGRQAVSLGMETLNLAKIHEQALLTAIPPKCPGKARDGLVKRAQIFFIEAITPIERTHLAAAMAEERWNTLSGTLHERTDELAVSKRDVKKGILERKAAEQALKSEGKCRAKSLEESRSLLESLRRLTHRVISAQENERGLISRELHDEIAQVLLGINVRLLTLQQKGFRDAKMLLREITATQQLVEDSVKTMRRFARNLQSPHEE